MGLAVIAKGNRRPRRVKSAAPCWSVWHLAASVQLPHARRAFVATVYTPGPAVHGALSRRVWQPPTREAPNY